MQMIKIQQTTDALGTLEIKVPTNSKMAQLEVIVIFSEAGFENKKPNENNFRKLVGQLNWKINPLEYQKKIRGEW